MRRCSILAILLVLCAFRAGATDHFVNLTSPNPTAPYSNWDTAATNIQDAIDAADPGDRVIVTNGVYNTGGVVVYGTLTNRIAITKPLTVQSVNGPDVTIIQGYQLPGVTNGPGAVRCVYMTNNTALIGFTITHGATDTTLDSSYNGFAGGVLCENYTNSVLSNCVIIANSANSIGGVLLGTLNNCLIASNSATMSGGGVWNSTLNRCTVKGNYAGGGSAGAYGNWGISAGEYWTTLNDCVITGNSTPGSGGGAQGELLNNCLVTGNQAGQGGGAANSQLYNCTVVSNAAAAGAGIYSSTANNSIVYYNNGPDIDSQTETYFSCTPILPFYELGGSITAAPQFVNPAAGDFHLQPTSPCINSGDNGSLVYTNTAQGDLLIFMTNSLDGNSRLVGGTVDMGAYEFQGNIHYVSQTSTTPLAPYSAWNTAATNIQDAIDAANPGDTVLVTNGLYNTGGRVTDGTLTNRVVIDKALTVQSVNGPDVTIIEGHQLPGTTNGPGAVRCVQMTTNTALIGFTITHGGTDTNINDNDFVSGGVRCLSFTNSVLSNCVIINNSAYEGGGISLGLLNNCVIANNSDVMLGGGATFSILNHCLVTNNYSFYGCGGIRGNSGPAPSPNDDPPTTANFCILMGNSSGAGFGPTEAYGGAAVYILNQCLIIGNKGDGAVGSRLFNCTVVSNSVGIEGCHVENSVVYYNDSNYSTGYFSYCCTVPDYSVGQNITNAPLFVDAAHGDFHLQSNSPCINSGYNGYLMLTNNEYDATTNFNVTLLTNDFDGNLRLVGGTVDMGAYEFQSSIRYVNVGSTNPVPPYTNWSTAATNIQDAIDAANPGDTVLVTNGLYNTGGRMTYPPVTNRVAITKPLTVQSVNGPEVTFIEGYQLPGITNGDGAMRCVYMTNNTSLIGFTVMHGATSTNSDATSWEDGGGILCSGLTNSVISNCVIINNSSAVIGGGVEVGTLNNCVIANNSDVYVGGGAAFCILNHCLVTNNYSFYGVGGIRGNTGAGVPLNGQPPQTASFCIIMGNSSGAGFGPTEDYGGVGECFLNQCLIIGNRGDGAVGCRLFNCTVVSNSVGIDGCQVLNSIVYYNDLNYPSSGGYPYFTHSCTIPLLSWDIGAPFQNVTNAPLFVDPAHGDFHLQSTSPCINAGYNGYLTLTNNEYDTTNIFHVTLLTNDFDGNPRLVGGTVDLGMYEFQSPASQISYAWLQQYGLPLDGSADNADPDGDGMSNWQEWRAGTLPLDNTSLLLMLAPNLSSTGATLTWQSQTNVNYYIQRTSQPGTPFSTIQSNIVGNVGTTSYIDTNGAGSGPFFYRVGVQ